MQASLMICINYLAIAIFPLLIFFPTVNGDVQGKCSWQNCPKTYPDQLNVHVICHSHDDMGYVKNVDQYYFGTSKDNVRIGVQYVLSTLVQELTDHPDRRFVQCETGFFWRWYTHQTDEVKKQMLQLVNNGQLEFVGGGWTQNDEAASHYVATIDQLTLGLSKLNEVYGECGRPKVAWQLDPFGHSREQASIFAQMGYDALYFARSHFLDLKARLANQSIDFMWHASDDLNTNIVTGTTYTGHYGPPPFLCFDELCDDDPVMDDPNMGGYNVDGKAAAFLSYAKLQAKYQRTNHLMVLMGGDFQYTNAEMVFTNMDKMFNYIRANLKAANPGLATKNDDFFPYATVTHGYWTGFFTSRPALKGFIRQSSSLLQVCKQFDAMANLGDNDNAKLEIFRQAVALTQHHDSITGTATQAVTYDYAKRLFKGWMQCQDVINDALTVLMPKSTGAHIPAQKFCPLSNVTFCDVAKATNIFTITVFNAQARTIATTVRIPYYGSNAVVKDPNGASVATQLVKTFAPPNQLQPYLPVIAPNELVIPINVGPLGYATYFVSDQANEKLPPSEEAEKSSKTETKPSVVLKNELIQLTFDANGLVSQYTDLASNVTISLAQELLYYKGMTSDSSGGPSGAYVFRPNGTTPFRIFQNQVTVDLVTGTLVNEVHQTFSPWASQVIRLYSNESYVEFEWTVGPIPKESRFTTNIASGKTYYTDANGRQIMKRVRNYASAYDYNNAEPVAANYYPVNSRIYIKDTNLQMTVLNDRSQGGASLTDGQIELMLHRRCFYDDGFGVGEPLNEPGVDGRGLVARGRHWLVIAPPAASAVIHRQFAFDLFHAPVLTFAPLTMTVNQYQAAFNTQFSGLRSPLPANVHLLSLEQWNNSTNLIRLEHSFQKDEDSAMSQAATVNLQNLFTTINVSSIMELMLGANIEMTKSDGPAESKDALNFVLNPMQIRTFKVSATTIGSTTAFPNPTTTTATSGVDTTKRSSHNIVICVTILLAMKGFLLLECY